VWNGTCCADSWQSRRGVSLIPIFNCQTASARRVYPVRAKYDQPRVITRILCGAGYAVILSLTPRSFEGMERRVAHHSSALCGAACVLADAHAPRRSIAAFLSLGAVLPGADGGLAANRYPGSFRRPSSAPRPAIKGSPS
jgi:hypothetical protein